MDSETRRFIQKEIARAMNIILSGLTGSVSTVETESIDQLFPGMGVTEQRPVMHPFGYASKAPTDTINVSARSGEHAGNRLVLGHRDSVRPDDIAQGESVLYASDGKTILRRFDLSADKITIGSKAAKENLILGQVWKTHYLKMLKELTDAIINLSENEQTTSEHIHIGIFGVPVNTPTNAALFVSLKEKALAINENIAALQAADIDSDEILSDDNFTEKKFGV